MAGVVYSLKINYRMHLCKYTYTLGQVMFNMAQFEFVSMIKHSCLYNLLDEFIQTPEMMCSVTDKMNLGV